MKRRALLTITGFVIVIWMFFGGSIGLTVAIYNYYSTLIDTLYWISLRRPYMSLHIELMREIVLTGSNTLLQDLEIHSQLARNIESEAQNFQISGSSILQGTKDISLQLDSSDFCDVVKYLMDANTYSDCLSFDQQSMQRGMEVNIYQIFDTIDAILNSYKQQNGYNITSLLNDPKWKYACKHNKNIIVGYIKDNFLDVGYDALEDTFMGEAIGFFGNTKTWTAIKDACFMVAFLLGYIFIINGFLNRLKEEMWQTKGLLNLIPTKFILNNPELKIKFLSHQGI